MNVLTYPVALFTFGRPKYQNTQMSLLIWKISWEMYDSASGAILKYLRCNIDFNVCPRAMLH
jgi:hypothetical protein